MIYIYIYISNTVFYGNTTKEEEGVRTFVILLLLGNFGLLWFAVGGSRRRVWTATNRGDGHENGISQQEEGGY